MKEQYNGSEFQKKKILEQMKLPSVKNQQINPIQITAEQIVSDPQIHQLDNIELHARQFLGDQEISDYKFLKRKKFEEKLRIQKNHIGKWIQYAEWELGLQEFMRARSIFERAIDVDPYKIQLWIRYAESEMKNKFINHARNIWERAIKIMPRVEQLWFKYIEMEETLGNYNQVRSLYKRWVQWNPPEKAWQLYIAFEKKFDESDNLKHVYYQYLQQNQNSASYLRVAKYEQRNKNYSEARFLYEKALEQLGAKKLSQKFFVEWARFEQRMNEIDRARQIYQYAMDNLDQDQQDWLREEWEIFEHSYSNKEDIEQMIYKKRLQYYQKKLKKSENIYDIYLDLLTLLEQKFDKDITLQHYEELQQTLPDLQNTIETQKYLYLIIKYSIYMELQIKDIKSTQNILQQGIDFIQQNNIQFDDLRIYFLKFLIRQDQVQEMRQFCGKQIGTNPSKKFIQSYFQLEYQMGNFDRCRKILEKQIEIYYQDPDVWIIYADFEEELGELERARQILESGLDIENLKQPELLQKNIIDMEIRNENFEEVRKIYKKLINTTKSISPYISYALFEFQQEEYDLMRKIFEKIYQKLKKEKNRNIEKNQIIQQWLQCEQQIQDQEWIQKVQQKVPKKITKQRQVQIYNNVGEVIDEKWEQYEDYIFAEDENSENKSKLLDLAMKWKNKKNNQQIKL